MFLENYRKFITYFGKNKRWQLTGFWGISLLAGMLELTGVALIYPFILLIMKPENINQSNSYCINNWAICVNNIYFKKFLHDFCSVHTN